MVAAVCGHPGVPSSRDCPPPLACSPLAPRQPPCPLPSTLLPASPCAGSACGPRPLLLPATRALDAATRLGGACAEHARGASVTCVRVRACVCVRVCACARVCVCVRACACRYDYKPPPRFQTQVKARWDRQFLYIAARLQVRMCVCIHTYIHAYIHTYMHTCIHTYVHTYVHTHVHTYMHTCIHSCIHTYVHACIHTHTHTYIHTHVHTYIHTYMHAYIHTYMHTYMHAYIHAYIHTYTHTHTHTRTSGQAGVVERIGVRACCRAGQETPLCAQQAMLAVPLCLYRRVHAYRRTHPHILGPTGAYIYIYTYMYI